jgi:hypothetical protein
LEIAVSGFYHVGVLVHDLAAAIPQWEKVFGITFMPPRIVPSTAIFHGERVDSDVYVAYSQQAPYIELIQGHADGYLSIAGGEGIHHLGLWTPAPGAEWNERFGGLTQEVEFDAMGGDVRVSLTAPQSLNGVRLELVDERIRPIQEAMIAGER